MEESNERRIASLQYLRAWLYALAILVFFMVMVGGATRLTDSGLSITEWQPLLGVIPPRTDADWLQAFGKYQLIPQYRTINPGMTLADFKVIYWWEWSHRFLGRFVGAAFLLPLMYFFLTRRLSRRLLIQLIAIFVLGGFQGALGWFMVASGLVDRVDVSQYRLAAHLAVAALIFAAILWVAFGLDANHQPPSRERDFVAIGIVALVVVQIAMGGFVAGLDAGKGYNTWPLMDGKLVPDGLYVMQPAWRNFFENAMTVQYNHRLLAYLIVVTMLGHAYLVRSKPAVVLLAVASLQALLGIWALLWQVPLWLGLAHQGGSLMVLAAALWNLHILLSQSPAPDQQ